jgi:hypothetical protein
MSNKKKMPFFLIGLLYSFLILGVIAGFFSLACVISFVFDINIFVVLVIEVLLLLIASYLTLDYLSNFDELDITFNEEDKEDFL